MPSRRLRRSDCSGPGLHRRRHGRGFTYTDPSGRRLEDPEALRRIAELTIPPAWRDVWICPDPNGHLQATGIDAAGRKQYLYHPRWREQRDRQKFREMVGFAQRLPRLRRRIAGDLAHESLDRERVLACAVRLLDLGLFRVGSEEYAEQGGGLGLATLSREHVSVRDGALVFDYPAKSGVRRVHSVRDEAAAEVVGALRRRRGGDTLLAYRDGRRWRELHSDDINEYIKQHLGPEFSAKDFRTWNATVLAAVALAAAPEPATTKAARERVIKGAVRQVAEALGNTPAVARRSYIDPRVFDRYLSGWTISASLAEDLASLDLTPDRKRRRLEEAVLDLLAGDADSPAVDPEGAAAGPAVDRDGSAAGSAVDPEGATAGPAADPDGATARPAVDPQGVPAGTGEDGSRSAPQRAYTRSAKAPSRRRSPARRKPSGSPAAPPASPARARS